MSDDKPQDLSMYQPLSEDPLPDQVVEDDPGPELRKIADQIMLLEARYKKLGRGAEKYQLDKVLKQLRDDFSKVFNRFDAWDEYRWPDGLTVRFLRKTGGRKIFGRVHPIFSREPEGLAPTD